MANLLSAFPRMSRLKICHRKLPHILHCKKRNLSPGTHCNSVTPRLKGVDLEVLALSSSACPSFRGLFGNTKEHLRNTKAFLALPSLLNLVKEAETLKKSKKVAEIKAPRKRKHHGKEGQGMPHSQTGISLLLNISTFIAATDPPLFLTTLPSSWGTACTETMTE